MSSYRIKRQGQESLIDGQDVLVRLARAGALGRADLIRAEGEADWVPAGEHPLTRESFEADPWAAWDELDDVDPDALWAQHARPVPAEVDFEIETTEDDDEEEDVQDEPTNLGPIEQMNVDAIPATDELPVLPSPEPRSSPRRATLKPPAPKPPTSKPSAPTRAAPPQPPKRVIQGGNAAGRRGQVIQFPAAARGGSRGAAEPAQSLPERALTPVEPLPVLPYQAQREVPILKAPPEPEPAVNPLRLGVAVLPFAIIFAVALWWIPTQATWTSPPELSTPGGVTTAPPPPPQPVADDPVAPTEPESPAADPAVDAEAERLAALLDQVRGDMRRETSDVAREGELTDALLMELSKLGLFGDIDAQVLTWTGSGSGRIPSSATIEIQVACEDREYAIAAVGLVVGKYVQMFGMDVPDLKTRFETPDGKLRNFPMDPGSAAKLYAGRVDLKSFLTRRDP